MATGFPDLPLGQIINVQWGGGVFVAAYQWFYTNPVSEIYTKSAGSEEWRVTYSAPGWGTPDNTITGQFMVTAYPGGAAYATVDDGPIFVMVGTDSGVGVAARAPGYILTSTNGKDWSDPIQKAAYGDFYLVTWNEDDGAFYAGMIDLSEVLDQTSDSVLWDVAYKSIDGLSWSEVGRSEWNADPMDPRAPVEQYCSDRIRDQQGHRVPTSVFGYDENKDILIAPDPLWITFGVTYPANEDGSPPDVGSALKIKRGPENPNPGITTVDLPDGMDICWAVAFYNGMWQAVGGVGDFPARGVIATSTDDGDSWEITFTGPAGSTFAAVAGGQPSG